MKLTVVGAIALIALALVALWISASLSLERSGSHTFASAALPGFGDSTSQRLVQIEANGHTFRARIGGFDNPNPEGDLLLLHGFPETSIMYETLIDAASRAGFRVVAFDQRGYSPGARPEGSSSYTGRQLVDDALAVADAVGFDRFHLVGHDWGAGVGWQMVFDSPQRLLSYSALSIPHLGAFVAALAEDPEQQSRSAYMGFFQLPWLPEQTFAVNDFAML
ncbi:MAG: alpha/beta fold hydrolase, partial [Pseudomonadales bacterium]